MLRTGVFLASALLATMSSFASCNGGGSGGGTVSVKSFTVTYVTDPGPRPQQAVVTVPQDGHTHPAVIVVHGGEWVGGSLNDTQDLSTQLATENDWVTVNIDYRVTTDGTTDTLPQAQLKDMMSAVAWARGHAATYWIDASRVAMLGAS